MDKKSVPLKINQSIRLTLADVEESWSASNIQNINNNEFCIAVPTLGANPVVLNKGEPVKVSFVFEGAKYEFQSRVTGRLFDNIPLYSLEMPSSFKRIQLREFVRILTFLEVFYAEIPEEGKEPVFIKGSSIDLSGGGVRLLLNKKYKEDTVLLIKFTIPFQYSPENVQMKGKVVRSWPDENTSFFQAAIQFQDISRKYQDSIVRYVFMKMSEQRRLK